MFITLKKEWQGQQPGTTIDIPEATVAKALVSEGIAAELSGDPYGGIIAKALDASVSNLTKNLDAIITTTLKQFADAQTKSRKNGAPLLFGDGSSGDHQRQVVRRLLLGRRPQRRQVISNSTTSPPSTPGKPRRPWATLPARPAATPCRPIST